jgi:biotin transport system substrate-specific component
VSASAASVGRPSVLADVLPRTRPRDAALVVLGAGLTAICAQISIHVPPSPVPITAQTFAVVIAGASLGGLRGGGSQLLYVLAGLALPVYADGAHGWAVVSGPSGGYLVAFPIAAYVLGRIGEHGGDRRLATAFPAYIAGQLIIFGIGVPCLKISTGLSWPTAIHQGFTIFIVGGLVKAAAAGELTPVAWAAVRKLGR